MSVPGAVVLLRDQVVVQRGDHDDLCVVAGTLDGDVDESTKRVFADVVPHLAASDDDHPLTHVLGTMTDHHVQLFASGSRAQVDAWLADDMHLALIDEALRYAGTPN